MKLLHSLSDTETSDIIYKQGINTRPLESLTLFRIQVLMQYQSLETFIWCTVTSKTLFKLRKHSLDTGLAIWDE